MVNNFNRHINFIPKIWAAPVCKIVPTVIIALVKFSDPWEFEISGDSILKAGAKEHVWVCKIQKFASSVLKSQKAQGLTSWSMGSRGSITSLLVTSRHLLQKMLWATAMSVWSLSRVCSMQFDELDEKRGGKKSSRDMVEKVTGSIELLDCETHHILSKYFFASHSFFHYFIFF